MYPQYHCGYNPKIVCWPGTYGAQVEDLPCENCEYNTAAAIKKEMRYKVCECSEFEDSGKVIETNDLQKAVQEYKKLYSQKGNTIPDVKLIVYLKSIETDVELSILKGNKVRTEDFDLYHISINDEYTSILEKIRNIISGTDLSSERR